MRVRDAGLPGVLLIEPTVYRDTRGRFLESWSRKRYADVGVPGDFVQDNVSVSHRGVLRGLHYQTPNPQGKLVFVPQGEVYDVVVDVRRGSPGFGRWVGHTLSDTNGLQLYLPPGFAHGFLVTSEQAVFAYKCTTVYDAAADGSVLWNDPDLGIPWPIADPILSDKDRRAPRLCEVPTERLPELGGP